MNWQQLHTTATPAEREEILLSMLRAIEARQHRLIFARGRLQRERRRLQLAHFIGDRRLRAPSSRSARLAFIYILATLSFAIWLIAFHIQPGYGAPLIFVHNLLLLAILLIKPYRIFTPLHSYSNGEG